MTRADFEVRLRNGVSGPARKAAADVEKLEKRMRRAQDSPARRYHRTSLMADRTRRRTDRERLRQAKALEMERARSAENASQIARRGLLGVASAAAIVGGAYAAINYSIQKGAYESASFAQSQEMAFEQLAKHGLGGTDLFNHVRASAQELSLDVKDTTKQYAKFLALQFTPQEADNLIKMGSDLRAFGNDAEAVQGIFTAMGQIKSKGRLQAEELLQMSERGVSSKLVQEEIGKILGKTQDEVRKLQEQGKVDAETALLGIEKAINRKLGQSEVGETGKRYAENTIDGMQDGLKARWDNLWIGLGQRTEGSFTELLTGGLDKFDNWIRSSDAEQFMDSVGDRVSNINDFLIDATGYAESFGKGLESGAKWVGPLGAFVDKVGDRKGDVGVATENFEKMGKALGATWKFAELTAIGLGKVGEKLAIFEKLGGVFEGLEKLDRWNTMLSGEHAGINTVESVLREALPDSTRALNGLLETGAGFTPTGLIGGMIQDGLTPEFKKHEILSAEVAMRQAGRDMMAGLAGGIGEGAPNAHEAARMALAGAVSAAREEIDAHSPSRVFQGLGGDSMAGYAGGVERDSRFAERAVTRSASRIVDGFSVGLGPLGPSRSVGEIGIGDLVPSSGAGAVFSGPFVHVEVHASSAEGDAIAESLAPVIETQVESLLSRWADQIGAPA